MRAAWCLGLGLLWLCHPAELWYRQAAGPWHYSVGRASGLLSGLHHPAPARRSRTAEPAPGAPLPGPARPHAAVLCVTDVAPEVRSCRELPGARGTFRCKADVTLSLDPLECGDP